ncbi:phosphoribosylanthranilate isomerase [Algoriphagus sp. 4150]|uniref:phosphoribosylanthranilate isomerase n=1 Tax=Algoriphagus sp. 4150 TaxID=2817756 RepID=UPI0028656DE3|nr:phosphoribosylanthranilate isomerase [Algoriphagus sp. 4150]MDR7132515.1 phosphoribosylanthranilate isomerase [Algoriphagus sp. 4150]
MALSTFVKISGITNLSDARYCAGMYVDLLGFAVEEASEKFITPTQFNEITGWVSGLEFVGEFTNYNGDQVLEILQSYPNLTWVEHDRIEPLEELEGKGVGLIYKMDLQEVRHIELEVAEKLNESGIIFHVISTHEVLDEKDKEAIKLLSKNCRVILGVGITAANVQDLIQELGLYGISLSGGEEIKPGLKDFDELADILEALEVED